MSKRKIARKPRELGALSNDSSYKGTSDIIDPIFSQSQNPQTPDEKAEPVILNLIKISRREFLNILGIFVFGTMLGSYLPSQETHDKKSEVGKTDGLYLLKGTDVVYQNSDTLVTNGREVLDSKITSIEEGFAKFGEKLLPKLGTLKDKTLKSLIEQTFDIVAHNSKVNKQRNVLTFAENQGLNLEDYVIKHYISQFYYKFKTMDLNDSVAGFSPSNRVMALSNNFNPTSDVDNLVFLHEMIHLEYDSLLRQQLKTDQDWKNYLDRYLYKVGEKPKFNIADEALAISCELEVMNLLLNNQLRSNVQLGKEIDINLVLEQLGADTPQEIGPLNFLLQIAKYYFLMTETEGQYSKDFLDVIYFAAKQRGFEVYFPTNDGKLIPYSEYFKY